VTARRKDGTLFPIDLVVSEIRDGGKFTAVIRDLSARRELDRRIAIAHVEERRRIARDLHDDLGGELTGIGLLVSSLQNQLRLTDSPHAARLASVLERVETAHERLREIARGLQAVEDVPEGLESALRALADRCTTPDGVACRLLPGPTVPIDHATIANELFYITQEAVNNALRHAQASEITIALSATPHGVRVEVSDNGIGFTHEAAGRGLGLSTMKQRARELGGSLDIAPREGGGTTVTCTIPPEEAARRSTP
jgi:signal transduction histidine kinase